ncbi:MAG: YtxH-like protein [bacterium ADurb.Bin429]|nr:MAG: YtxH-like protein [bacterium ADurb.Bin429]
MTEDPRQSAWPGLMAGLLVGAVVGAVTALLFAPKSGEETRETLMEEMRERLGDLRDGVEQVKADLTRAAEAAKAGARDGAARMRRQVGLE